MHSLLSVDVGAPAVSESSSSAPIISVVLAALNEGENIGPLIDRLHATLNKAGLSFEVILVDGGSQDKTWEEAERRGARCLLQRRVGYGGAVREGFAAARGEYVLTMDCDLSHPPELFEQLWAARAEADVLVGSRFVAGGTSRAPFMRKVLSEILNFTFSRLLAVPIKDSSSGYRLYRRTVLQPQSYTRENFNVLQEVLVKAYADGYSVKELPLEYKERASGESHVSLVKFCLSYLPTLYRLWLLRNSTDSADYDHRAYSSRHYLQRYWQRKRAAIIKEFLAEQGGETLCDVGCGSSRTITERRNAVAVDLAMHKLRFLKRTNRNRVRADVAALPFRSEVFNRLVVSQVLQSVDAKPALFQELYRVMRKGGIVVVSVPDSSRLQWRFIGFLYHLLPNVYGREERSVLTRRELVDSFAEQGFRVLKYRYICGAELILKLERL